MLRIVFLCGTLEPGCDGVGDYTRRLAAELIRQGHQAFAVALNDFFVKKKVKEIQLSANVEVPVLRLPSIWTNSIRFGHAKAWISFIDPEWVSLQFVIYSFDPSGIPLFLSKHLKKLTGGKNLHVMFHELWIGVDRSSIIKSFIKAYVQKMIIKQLLLSLNPLVVHTHLPFFRSELGKIGRQVKSLPLFSNIDVNANFKNNHDEGIFKIGIFSQAEVSNSISDFLKDVEKQISLHDQKMEILLIGGSEDRMRLIKEELDKVDGCKFNIKITGHLVPEELSLVLQSCTLGLTPIPRHGLGKSGSVAAFIAHGVPVAAPNFCNSYASNNIGLFSKFLRPAIVLQPNLNQIEQAKSVISLAKSEILSSKIAKKFISDLNLRSHSN